VNDGLRLYNISAEGEESVAHCDQKQFLEIPFESLTHRQNLEALRNRFADFRGHLA